MPAELRYFSTDTHILHGLICYKLALTTGSLGLEDCRAGSKTLADVDYAVKRWKRSAAGVETEITPTGYRAMVTHLTTDPDSTSKTATDTPDATPLDPTDTIVVRVYQRIKTWVSLETWQTEELGAQQLDNATWEVQYRLFRYLDASNIWIYCFWFGILTPYSRIDNFSWTPAPVALSFLGDGLACYCQKTG